jgi:hypothetical protein
MSCLPFDSRSSKQQVMAMGWRRWKRMENLSWWSCRFFAAIYNACRSLSHWYYIEYAWPVVSPGSLKRPIIVPFVSHGVQIGCFFFKSCLPLPQPKTGIRLLLAHVASPNVTAQPWLTCMELECWQQMLESGWGRPQCKHHHGFTVQLGMAIGVSNAWVWVPTDFAPMDAGQVPQPTSQQGIAKVRL